MTGNGTMIAATRRAGPPSRARRGAWGGIAGRVLPRLLLVAVGVAVATAPLPAAADNLALPAAINKAGRQRMLTQRIVKLYCQMGLGVMAAESRRQLDDAVATFDTQLAELKASAPDDGIRGALAQVEALWAPFKEHALAPPQRDGAKRLLYWNDDLLHASHKVVQLLQDISDAPYARLVNVSGRQRMLSQRLAKFYMLREWGFDTLTIRDEIERARNDFAGALTVLQTAPENTEAITRELEAIAMQWRWFDSALNLQGARSYRLIVADASESILNGMDLVTEMYQALFE
jgi:nitrate/nitrite-specific signal transduction histidine kinase